VQVAMRKGTAAAAAGDVGYVYLLVLDPGFQALAQAESRGTAGAYGWEFLQVPEASYYLVAGTDFDNDGLICDEGEACGAWPTLNQPAPWTLTADKTDLEFLVGYDAGLGLQSAGRPAAWPEGGFRLPTARKAFGGAR